VIGKILGDAKILEKVNEGEKLKVENSKLNAYKEPPHRRKTKEQPYLLLFLIKIWNFPQNRKP
jgi:hypothetical protein